MVIVWPPGGPLAEFHFVVACHCLRTPLKLRHWSGGLILAHIHSVYIVSLRRGGWRVLAESHQQIPVRAIDGEPSQDG